LVLCHVLLFRVYPSFPTKLESELEALAVPGERFTGCVWHAGTSPACALPSKGLSACQARFGCIRIKLSLGGTLCLSPFLDIVALPYSPSFW